MFSSCMQFRKNTFSFGYGYIKSSLLSDENLRILQLLTFFAKSVTFTESIAKYLFFIWNCVYVASVSPQLNVFQQEGGFKRTYLEPGQL